MKKLSAIVYITIITGMLFSAAATYLYSKEYESINTAMTTESRLKNKVVGIFSSDYPKRVSSLKELADQAHGKVDVYKVLFFLLAGAFICLAAWKKSKPLTCGAVLVVSFIALTAGLITPVFSVVFYQTLPVVGRFVVRFESIGIVSSIRAWWTSGNYFIASLVVLFSFVVPLVKSGAIGYVIMFPGRVASGKMLKIFEMIGSWSMLDVFIVAILIVVVSMNGRDAANAEIQAGLYFFLTYVILSMVSTQLFINHLKSTPHLTRRRENTKKISQYLS